jgi:hypothetical protein
MFTAWRCSPPVPGKVPIASWVVAYMRISVYDRTERGVDRARIWFDLEAPVGTRTTCWMWDSEAGWRKMLSGRLLAEVLGSG